ncbi:MAG: FAD:protein FMN transferase [Gemmatimonadota bacterium]|nr:MAG: FAD:protein FMN transferase [Gemmatimonadota bacterium]
MHDAARTAEKLSALLDLGFERVDIAPVTCDAVRIDRKSYRITAGKPAMGTYVQVLALHRSRAVVEEAIGRAFEEMERLIRCLSRFDSGSSLTELNQAGYLRGAPPELAHLIERSLAYNALSRNAFDISVGPLIDLFRNCRTADSRSLPAEAEIREALELVGSDKISLKGRTISLARSGMGITLDGIAKGFIVDRMAEVLLSHKIGDFLINAGGDIRAAGRKEGKRPWTVAVQDPAKHGAFPDVIELRDAAVATSGSYEIYFDSERAFHHILSSETGRSPSGRASVSVVAPSALAADALATGVFVMEPGMGIPFIDSLGGCECLVLDTSGRKHGSSGWRSAAPVS